MRNRPANGSDRVLTMEIARITECAAIAAARHRGRGDEMAADQAAVAAMHRELGELEVKGQIVVGEGDKDEAPALYNGEKVGKGRGPKVDIALAPLEGSTICAKDLPESISVIAVAGTGGLLQAPRVYMEKLAVGPGYSNELIDLDRPLGETIHALAKAKGVATGEICACVLDRPRNAETIEAIRASGASVRLIGDGDVASIIHAASPDETGIDLYAGIGGAPEGVLAAAALRCTGGQMQARLVLRDAGDEVYAREAGIEDLRHCFEAEELAAGDVVFAATGVTDGRLLDGVRFGRRSIRTETVVMRSASGTIRKIVAEHAADAEKFLSSDGETP